MTLEQEEDEFHGLDLSRAGVINEHNISAAREKIENMLAEVKVELEARGIPEPPRPKGHPRSLADLDINLLTNSEVAGLYTQYVAYAAYIGDELAEIEGNETAAKRLLRETLAELKDAQFAKGLKGAEATAAATKDPLYRDLDQEFMKLFFMKSIMSRRYRGYTTCAAALSRVVELRKLDFEQTRRDGNLGFRTRNPGQKPTPNGFGPASGRKPSSG